MRTGPPRLQILHWLVADTCDLKPDEPSVDYPLCAEITFVRGGEAGEFLIQVGTSKKGIAGSPQLDYGVGTMEAKNPLVLTGSSQHLSDLSVLLDQPAVTYGVQKLYSEIVAHHPIGIPAEAEMVAIRPYLSKRLAQQLQTAHACQDHYNRQHATANETSIPSWLKSGLFFGDGSHASPVDALVERREKQNDGSFTVYVDLEPADAVVNLDHGRRAFHGGYTWQVKATVIPEDGRFVVDDVRIFDRFPAEVPSRLLSDSFSGCDGPHWTGHAATLK